MGPKKKIIANKLNIKIISENEFVSMIWKLYYPYLIN